MEAMLSGSPLLFLDLRDRTLLGKVPDRATLLARAKEEYVKHCDAMLEQKVAECLDACSVAYFHEVQTWLTAWPGLPSSPLCTPLDRAQPAPTLVSSTAPFHFTPPPWQALFGDGDVINSQAQQKDEAGRRRPVPLHEAITRAKDGRGTADDGLLARATVQQVNDTAQWLAERFFTDGWAVMTKQARKAAEDAANAAGKPAPDAMSHYVGPCS